MRVFRKRKKFGNFHGPPRDAEPLPDIVYQMGAEQAARLVALQSRSSSPFAAAHGTFSDPNFPTPYIVDDENAYGGMHGAGPYGGARSSSPLNFIANALGIGRSRSRRQIPDRAMEDFVRPGSPAHFGQLPPGTPVQYRRRAFSPELVRSRPSSPYQFVQPEQRSSPLHFAHQSRPASPDFTRRLQRAQLSQEMQHVERQQRRQQEMMTTYPAQYIPQYQQAQQPYYPMMNSNPYNQGYMINQQPQMYSYY